MQFANYNSAVEYAQQHGMRVVSHKSITYNRYGRPVQRVHYYVMKRTLWGETTMVRIKWFTNKFHTGGLKVKAVAVLDRADIVDAALIEELSIGNREDIRDGKIANRMFVDWCYGGWCEVTDVECPDNKDY